MAYVVEGELGPLEFFFLDHQEHLKLCDLLEEIADSLPHHIDRSQCACAALALRHRVDVHHRLEEVSLFPRILARAGDNLALRATLERLSDEHRTDEGHCDEAVELLTSLERGGMPGNLEAAGYLLRGLFEGLRRHIAFENEHILPKAEELLSEDDLHELALEIQAENKSRAPMCFRADDD